MLRRLTLLLGLILIALVLGAATWVLFTESGLRLIASQLYRLERFGVRIEGVSGTLTGPIRIERFELDHRLVHVVVTGIAAEPRLRALVLQTVAVESLSAGSALVELREGDAGRQRQEPPRFLPQWLRVQADRTDLHDIRFVNAAGTVALEAHRLRGRIRLSGEQLRVDELLIEADQFVAGGRVRVRAEQEIRLEIVTSGRLLISERPDIELSAELRGTPAALDLRVQMQSPGTGTATATIAKSGGIVEQWQVRGHIRSEDPQLGAWLSDPPFSVRDVDVEFEYADGAATAAGTFLVPELDPLPVSATASGRYADRTLVISRAELRLQDSPTVMTVDGRLHFDARAPAVNLAARWAELAWPLREAAQIHSTAGHLSVSGQLPYQFALSSQFQITGQPAAEIAANGVVDRSGLDLQNFRARLQAATLDGHGRLLFGDRPRWQGELRARQVDPGLWMTALAGQLDFDIVLTGEGLDRTATGAAVIESVGGSLRGLPVAGSGRVARSPGGWQIKNLVARLGGSRARIDAELGESLRAEWSLGIDSLQALWPESKGTLSFSGSAAGDPVRPQISARLSGSEVGYAGWSAQSLQLAADIDLADREPSHVDLALTGVGGERPIVHSLELTANGLSRSHEIRLTADSTDGGPEGHPARVQLAAQGSYVEGVWTGRLAQADVVEPLGGRSMQLAQPVELSIAREQASVGSLCLYLGEGRFCGKGEWNSDGPWSIDADADNIPLAFFGDVLPGAPRYAGRWEARLNARGQGANVTSGDARLRLSDGRVTYRLVGGEKESVRLGTGVITINVTPERVAGALHLEASEETFVAAELRVLRDPSKPFLQQPITGRLTGRSPDTGVLPLVVPELDDVGGRLEADLALFGTLAAPQIDGTVGLRDGSVDLYRLNLSLRDAELVARLRENSLSLTGKARVGEGRLSLDGDLSWRDGLAVGRVGLKGENLLIADVPELRLVASPDIEFRIDGRSLAAEGEVLIPSARIEPRDLRTAASTSPDARIVGEHAADERSSLEVRSRIRVTLGNDVRIDAIGLSGKLAGSVTAITGVEEIDLGRGEISVESGKYEAYGQKLDIVRGRLLYDGTSLADPGLDVQAEKEVAEVTVGLNVRGTLRNPRLSFYSDPSMPQSQILSYMLIGKPIDEAGSQEVATVGAARENIALQGGGLIASQLGRRVGLEQVAVESSGQDDTSLVLGKFLSPRLFVSYGISLTEAINTLKIRYTISDRWVLKTEAGEQQSADLEFTIER